MQILNSHSHIVFLSFTTALASSYTPPEVLRYFSPQLPLLPTLDFAKSKSAYVNMHTLSKCLHNKQYTLCVPLSFSSFISQFHISV